MCATVWFNAYSVIELFFFSATFVESFSDWWEIFKLKKNSNFRERESERACMGGREGQRERERERESQAGSTLSMESHGGTRFHDPGIMT